MNLKKNWVQPFIIRVLHPIDFFRFSDLLFHCCLGGISSKGLTLHPKDGNEGIRVYETPAGMMNSVGLQNPGIEAFIKDGIRNMRKFDTVLIANMGGHSMEDYVTGAEMLSNADIDMLELTSPVPM